MMLLISYLTTLSNSRLGHFLCCCVWELLHCCIIALSAFFMYHHQLLCHLQTNPTPTFFTESSLYLGVPLFLLLCSIELSQSVEFWLIDGHNLVLAETEKKTQLLLFQQFFFFPHTNNNRNNIITPELHCHRTPILLWIQRIPKIGLRESLLGHIPPRHCHHRR